MKKAFNWSITAIGVLCLVFLAGMFTGRHTVNLPNSTLSKETAISTSPSVLRQPQTLININTADAAILETLPGIGETLANRIIAYREENGPFENALQLRMVEGIGDGKLQQIYHLICTED